MVHFNWNDEMTFFYTVKNCFFLKQHLKRSEQDAKISLQGIDHNSNRMICRYDCTVSFQVHLCFVPPIGVDTSDKFKYFPSFIIKIKITGEPILVPINFNLKFSMLRSLRQAAMRWLWNLTADSNTKVYSTIDNWIKLLNTKDMDMVFGWLTIVILKHIPAQVVN